MERKLIKQGRNALTVTLPANWTKARGLTAGDTVSIIEENEELLVRTGPRAEKKSITIRVVDQELNVLWHTITGRYIEGYDEITVFHSDPRTVQIIAKELIGVVLEEHTDSKSVLRNIIVVPEENFRAIFRRAGHLLVQIARTLEGVAQGEKTLADMKDVERALDGTLMYCLRYLHKYENSNNSYRNFLLCTTMEEAGDLLKTLAKHIGKRVTLAAQVRKMVEEYDSLLFKQDFARLYSRLRRFRNQFATKRFADGIAFWLAETLYNYLGYLVPQD